MRDHGRTALVFAGIASGAVALLHLVIVLLGAPGFRYFGAATLADAVERGSMRPAIVTLALAAVFAVWAAYALSGAGLVVRLPLLRTGLLLIGLIFTLRGMLAVPEAIALARGSLRYPRALAFSTGSLVIGGCYLLGLISSRLTPTVTPRSSPPRSRP